MHDCDSENDQLIQTMRVLINSMKNQTQKVCLFLNFLPSQSSSTFRLIIHNYSYLGLPAEGPDPGWPELALPDPKLAPAAAIGWYALDPYTCPWCWWWPIIIIVDGIAPYIPVSPKPPLPVFAGFTTLPLPPAALGPSFSPWRPMEVFSPSISRNLWR